MRPYPVVAFVAALALSACGQSPETEQTEPAQATEPAQQQAPPQEQADLTPASDEDLKLLGDGIASGQVRSGGQCDTSKRGQVNLRVRGQQGDGFRVILMCGSTEVARCHAYISADPATATCPPPGALPGAHGPNPQPPGARRCILGPQNGNSAAADASFLCPEV